MNKIKRPLVNILIGLLIGIIYGLYFKTSIAIIIIILLILFIISYFITKKKRLIYFLIRNKKLILIILISSIISNIYLNFVNNQYEKIYKTIPKNFQSIATVVSDAKETEYYYSYNIKIGNKKFIAYVDKNQKLKYGNEISIIGEYSKPEDSRNYKGFSYKEYLKTQKIYGSIKIKKIEIIKECNVNLISKFSNNIRNKILQTIEKIIPKTTRGLLSAILIGETQNISDEIKDEFRNSNLSHIVAISGSHITYIIAGISYILLKSKISKRIIYIFTIVALILFMLITGFAPSIVRACIMGIIMLCSKIFYRKLDILTSIALSLILILINNPYSIGDIGLQLSYFGTLGIIFLNKPILKFLKKHIKEKIAEIISITISAQIVILPIMLLQFNNLSTIFLISNILAVPLSGIIILLGYANVLIGIISIKIGKILGIFTNGFTQILIWIARYTSKIPFSNIILTTPSVISIIVYYILIYCIYKKKNIKIALTIFVITIISTNLMALNYGKMKIHFIDVGQRRLYSNTHY